MTEWSDIRIFLHVARQGSMIGSSTILRMDHATISRRIARLEEQTGVRLFDRAGRRLALTAEGRKLVTAAEKLEAIILRDVDCLAGEGEEVSGTVRIGTSEEFAIHYLAERLAALSADHPRLEIELVALPRAFSLATRDVDLMITLDRPITGDIRFRKLTDLEFGIYGSRTFFAGRARPSRLENLGSEVWCGYIPDLLHTPQLDFLGSIQPRFRSTSSAVQMAAALAGNALAALPCFIADAHPDLERVLPDEARFERTYWIAVHQDLADAPRVRAVMDGLAALVGRDRDLFRGSKAETPLPGPAARGPMPSASPSSAAWAKDERGISVAA